MVNNLVYYNKLTEPFTALALRSSGGLRTFRWRSFQEFSLNKAKSTVQVRCRQQVARALRCFSDLKNWAHESVPSSCSLPLADSRRFQVFKQTSGSHSKPRFWFSSVRYLNCRLKSLSSWMRLYCQNQKPSWRIACLSRNYIDSFTASMVVHSKYIYLTLSLLFPFKTILPFSQLRMIGKRIQPLSLRTL